MKKTILLLLCISASPSFVFAGVSVKTVDFLEVPGVDINAAGPLLVRMDDRRNRLIVANTLSSSLTIIDCRDDRVTNIALGGRALQHLKSESMTVSRQTGDIYLIGSECFFIVSPRDVSARTVPTDVQYESIAVDESSGNVFIVGRESESLGFYDRKSGELRKLPWLDHKEDLINLNQTPPPPIRKVTPDRKHDRIIAVDGFTSTICFFDGRDGVKSGSRQLGLTSGGRWHLAGFSEEDQNLFLVVETKERKVIEAARIDVEHGKDVIVPLPGFTEGVGIIYNPKLDEVYIPYDNYPSVHVVNFDDGGRVEEIKIPAYGNDASVIDLDDDILYVSSWAFGEIDEIDLETRKLVKRHTGLGIVPHMFTMSFNPSNNRIYFPRGGTAVNGTFGSAVSVFDPAAEHTTKIHTGWAPIDLIELPGRDRFLVFNSEDQFAEVHRDGSYALHDLPFDYPVRSTYSPGGDVYLSYGPHQTYWPVVYIWGAKNGVLTIDAKDLSFYDRRIPRQAHEMVLDQDGTLYFTQNNWGREEQFLGLLEDEVRVFEAGNRIALADSVEREITQRILRYDPDRHRLFLVRVGEKDDDPSVLQVIDPADRTVIHRMTLGLTATDLAFDRDDIYIANFDSRNVSVIDRSDFTSSEIETGEQPLKLCNLDGDIYVINHGSNSLQKLNGRGEIFEIPYPGRPDNIFTWDNRLIITSHSEEALFIIRFDPESRSFSLLHEESYPYGDTGFDSRNVSFYLNGQYGDAVFSITRGKESSDGRLWVTDFLSGSLFILEED